MSAVPTKPPSKSRGVSAAGLLAGATKKSKTTNHLVYPGEAGRESASRWLEPSPRPARSSRAEMVQKQSSSNQRRSDHEA